MRATAESRSRYFDIPNVTVPLDQSNRLPQPLTALRQALAPNSDTTTVMTAIAVVATAAESTFAHGVAVNDFSNPTAAHLALTLVAQLNRNDASAFVRYQVISQLAAEDNAAGHAMRIALGAAICYGTPGAAAAHSIISNAAEGSGNAVVGAHVQQINRKILSAGLTGVVIDCAPDHPAYADVIEQLHAQCLRIAPSSTSFHSSAALQALLIMATTESEYGVVNATIALVDLVSRTPGPDLVVTLGSLAAHSTDRRLAAVVSTVLRDAYQDLLQQRNGWSHIATLARDHSPMSAIAHDAAVSAVAQQLSVMPQDKITPGLKHITNTLRVLATSSSPAICETVASTLITTAALRDSIAIAWLGKIFWPQGSATRAARAIIALELPSATGIYKVLRITTETAAVPFLDHGLRTAPRDFFKKLEQWVTQSNSGDADVLACTIYLLHRLAQLAKSSTNQSDQSEAIATFARLQRHILNKGGSAVLAQHFAIIQQSLRTMPKTTKTQGDTAATGITPEPQSAPAAPQASVPATAQHATTSDAQVVTPEAPQHTPIIEPTAPVQAPTLVPTPVAPAPAPAQRAAVAKTKDILARLSAKSPVAVAPKPITVAQTEVAPKPTPTEPDSPPPIVTDGDTDVDTDNDWIL